MSDWREELRAASKAPAEQDQGENQKVQKSIQAFYEYLVLPAFEDLKAELEKQEKIVEILGYPPGASLAVRDKSTPRLDEFRYAIVVEDDGLVHASVAYLEAHCSTYTTRKIVVKEGAGIQNLTQDDVAMHFTFQYIRVRDQLISENLEEFRHSALQTTLLEEQGNALHFSSTEIWKFLQKEI